MPKNPFQPSVDKINRAEKLRAELNQSIATYFEGEWHHTSYKQSDEPSDKIGVTLAHLLDPSSMKFEHTSGNSLQVFILGMPNEFNAILGDIVHNLRSALDLLIVQAVLQNGGNAKYVAFPFSKTEKDYKKEIKKRKVSLAGQEIEKIVSTLCPYKDGDKYLRALHDLDILDKHINLVDVSIHITTPKVGVVLEDDGVTPKGISEGKVALELKSELVPSVRFVFAEGVPLEGEEILASLDLMENTVQGIVDRFFTALNS